MRDGKGGWRSDGVINDRVFNTLYGLAYKLRAVHRSSWQRINGRGADHGDDLSLLPTLPRSLLLCWRSVSDLSADRLGARVIVLRFFLRPPFPFVRHLRSFHLSFYFSCYRLVTFLPCHLLSVAPSRFSIRVARDNSNIEKSSLIRR